MFSFTSRHKGFEKLVMASYAWESMGALMGNVDDKDSAEIEFPVWVIDALLFGLFKRSWAW